MEINEAPPINVHIKIIWWVWRHTPEQDRTDRVLKWNKQFVLKEEVRERAEDEIYRGKEELWVTPFQSSASRTLPSNPGDALSCCLLNPRMQHHHYSSFIKSKAESLTWANIGEKPHEHRGEKKAPKGKKQMLLESRTRNSIHPFPHTAITPVTSPSSAFPEEAADRSCASIRRILRAEQDRAASQIATRALSTGVPSVCFTTGFYFL